MEVRGYESQQPYVTRDQVLTYQVDQCRIYWTMGFPRMGYDGSTVLRSNPLPFVGLSFDFDECWVISQYLID